MPMGMARKMVLMGIVQEYILNKCTCWINSKLKTKSFCLNVDWLEYEMFFSRKNQNQLINYRVVYAPDFLIVKGSLLRVRTQKKFCVHLSWPL